MVEKSIAGLTLISGAKAGVPSPNVSASVPSWTWSPKKQPGLICLGKDGKISELPSSDAGPWSINWCAGVCKPAVKGTVCRVVVSYRVSTPCPVGILCRVGQFCRIGNTCWLCRTLYDCDGLLFRLLGNRTGRTCGYSSISFLDTCGDPRWFVESPSCYLGIEYNMQCHCQLQTAD